MIELIAKVPIGFFIVLAAIIGILGAFLTQRHFVFRQASAKFNNDILSIFKGLYPDTSNWPKDGMAIDGILRGKFPDLQAAVGAFRHAIPWYRWDIRRKFDRAWKIYHLGEDGVEIDGQYYWHYIPTCGSSMVNGKEVKYDNTTTYKENFKRNVAELLKWAK